jgi:acetyl esterase/lipase
MVLQQGTVVYKSVGNRLLEADVYRSTRRNAAQATIVFIHGGALMMGDRTTINREHVSRYLEAGYDVASIDYRLAPETKLADIIEDLRDAFRWVGSPGTGLAGAGAGRVVATGYSAGGYLALISGDCCSPRPKAIVSFYGYGDIVGDWYTKPSPFYCHQPLVSDEEAGHLRSQLAASAPHSSVGRQRFYLYCRQKGIWPLEVSGHDPSREPSYFAPFCPQRNVTGAYPPTMFLHGDQDTDVPYEQSALMARELERQGVPWALQRMEGCGHGFDSDSGTPAVDKAFTSVLSFLATYTR